MGSYLQKLQIQMFRIWDVQQKIHSSFTFSSGSYLKFWKPQQTRFYKVYIYVLEFFLRALPVPCTDYFQMRQEGWELISWRGSPQRRTRSHGVLIQEHLDYRWRFYLIFCLDHEFWGPRSVSIFTWEIQSCLKYRETWWIDQSDWSITAYLSQVCRVPSLCPLEECSHTASSSSAAEHTGQVTHHQSINQSLTDITENRNVNKYEIRCEKE